MTAHHIRYAVDGDGVATITIDRAEKRNAMTYAMLFAFIDAVKQAGADDNARVVIVTGAGGTFCAGTDLADLATIPGETRGVRGEAHEESKWWPLVACPKPVIGAIDGYAVGMGAEFSSQCDVRIVTNRAKFAWNFAHRGLVPDTGAGSWLLPRLIGPSRALRLLYSGDFLDASEAHAIGYANQIVAPEVLMETALAEAHRYLKSSPFSLKRMKELVWRGMERDVGEHMAAHVTALSACFKSADHKEGVASFLEKRPAKFTGS
ncbi:MAG: enoyl-CoA hydratase/isomerase family protein [Hyphomonadaceae bacterium]|nr:MAG: enoyl-CoA hydratase/isomerase family protein [Caulobacteraceae bacterium]MBT9445718.1 enoyl-CoA hydratase/isomerase family protein [Hyphomonadaceae bacterium]TPW06256.1 MAG: enoyl-CoA hydratase/isomerase family protein [Alphaproteobacteria bacterium]